MISVGLLRGLLKLPSTPPNPDRDAQLGLLIDGATGTIGRELNLYLGLPAQALEVHDKSALVLLPDEPQKAQGQSAPALKVEERATVTSAWVTVTPSRYSVDGRAVRFHEYRHRGRSFLAGEGVAELPNRGRACLRVTYLHGYAVDTGPAELRLLVADVAAAKWRARGREGLQSETIGDYSYTVADLEKAADWPAICARWRRQPV